MSQLPVSTFTHCSSIFPTVHICYGLSLPETPYLSNTCDRALLTNIEVENSCTYTEIKNVHKNVFVLSLPEVHLLYFF